MLVCAVLCAEGHPGAICQVAARLMVTNPRDGQTYCLHRHKDEFLRIIIPGVLRCVLACSVMHALRLR